MDLENQVCTLIQAKKLKSLGVKYPSLFYWAAYQIPHIRAHVKDIQKPNGSSPHAVIECSSGRIVNSSCFPAYTASELGVILAKAVFDTDHKIKIIIDENGLNLIHLNQFNEAISRADLLIELIENGIIKV